MVKSFMISLLEIKLKNMVKLKKMQQDKEMIIQEDVDDDAHTTKWV